MPVQQLKKFLEEQGVRYTCEEHKPAFTAQEIAHSAHICGDQLAKTVIINMDGKLAMVVLPATCRIRWDRFMNTMGTDFIELADEDEFKDMFAGCELGAMPPFGNLYGMDVFVHEALANNEEISFSAGTHHEIIRLRVDDYLRLVSPILMSEGFMKPNLNKPAWLSNTKETRVAS